MVHAYTPRLARTVATLGASFAAEDLAVAYCDRRAQVALGVDVGIHDRYGLVLVAPGLCPPSVLPVLIEAQHGPRGDEARPVRH